MLYAEYDNLIIRPMTETDRDGFYDGFKLQGWDKPREQFENYFNMQKNGERIIIVAQWDDRAAGYVTLVDGTDTGPFAGKGYPEIVDFNVLERFQRLGIGGKIMDTAEKLAAEKSDTVTLGVGLYAGYGTAQRMYVKRGYIPDGSGIWYKGEAVPPYSHVCADDELVMYFSKRL